MDESTLNLTCLQVAEYRELGKALPEALASHWESCADCHAVGEIDNLLEHYAPPKMSGYSRERLVEITKPKLPQANWWRYAVAAALACLIGGNLYLRRPPAFSPVAILPQVRSHGSISVPAVSLPVSSVMVAVVEGSCVMRQPGQSSWKPLHPQDRLTPESTITIPAKGRLRLTYPDGTEMVLLGNTQGTLDTITSSADGVDAFFLVRGKIFVHHHGNPLVILTADSAIEAIGTEFSVHQEKSSTHVRVFRGLVRVKLVSSENSAMMRENEELRFAPQSKLAVKRFGVQQVDPWEKNEIKVSYLKEGRMVETLRRVPKHLNSPHLAPVQRLESKSVQSLENHSQNYNRHANRLETKLEDQMKNFEEHARKQQEKLLEEMKDYDQSVGR